MRGHDEEGLNVMFLKEGVSLVAEAWLHLVVPVQALQGGSCDVHFTRKKMKGKKNEGVMQS